MLFNIFTLFRFVSFVHPRQFILYIVEETESLFFLHWPSLCRPCSNRVSVCVSSFALHLRTNVLEIIFNSPHSSPHSSPIEWLWEITKPFHIHISDPFAAPLVQLRVTLLVTRRPITPVQWRLFLHFPSTRIFIPFQSPWTSLFAFMGSRGLVSLMVSSIGRSGCRSIRQLLWVDAKLEHQSLLGDS